MWAISFTSQEGHSAVKQFPSLLTWTGHLEEAHINQTEQHKMGHCFKRGKTTPKGVILIWHKPTPLGAKLRGKWRFV